MEKIGNFDSQNTGIEKVQTNEKLTGQINKNENLKL